MKKISYILPLLWACTLSALAQGTSIDGDFSAKPSAASLPNYINNPVSYATGIQDVSFPLFTLKTHSADITLNTGISYHPNNALRPNRASDIGIGWSVNGAQGVIYNDLGGSGFPSEFFYFSFLGNYGKFSLKKNAANEWMLLKMDKNKLNITFTEVNGKFTFKITDELGNNYFFDLPDMSYTQIGIDFTTFVSAYYLSKITDVHNKDILTYEYIEDNYTVGPPGAPSLKPVKGLKLSKVVSPGLGSVQFNYSFNAAQRKSYNDPFQLESMELKTVSGKLIQKYGFQHVNTLYNYPYGKLIGISDPCMHSEYQSKRALSKLLTYDRLNNYKATEFSYNTSFINNYWVNPIDPVNGCFENEGDNPIYLAQGLLSSIKYPTGAEVRYEYEPNQYYVNKNTSDYKQNQAPPHTLMDRQAQEYEYIGNYSFDTDNGTLGMFNLPTNPDEPQGASYLAYTLTVGEYYPPGPIYPINTDPYINIEFSTAINLPDNKQKFMPGFNSFALSGTGGKGSVTIWRIRYKSVPLPNYSTGKGVRIKKVEYYDNTTLVSSQTKRFYYQKFEDNNMPSGILNEFDENQSVVYKNVKEVIGEDGGYTKYYFKTVDSYPENLDSVGNVKSYDLKYANILEKGLLNKKEIYDKNNTLIASEVNDFEFQEIPLMAPYGKHAVIKKHVITSKSILPSGTITQISESIRDSKDFNVTYKKTTEADDNITEEFITYPWGVLLEDPKLFNAGIKDIPLKIEVKRNGTTISKTETKYADTSHFHPTAQVSYLPDNLSHPIKDISYDLYDDKGNLVQFTIFPEVGNTGKSTTIIWGYNKTMPIAKIEGAKLSDIPAALIAAIVNASNEDANATTVTEAAKEQVLINSLNTFKNDPALAGYMITANTYDLLIGVTSLIPPNGMIELYKYDASNRLEKVLDVNGNILKEYKYNTKH